MLTTALDLQYFSVLTEGLEVSQPETKELLDFEYYIIILKHPQDVFNSGDSRSYYEENR